MYSDDKIHALARYQLERTQSMEMMKDSTKMLVVYNKFISYAKDYAKNENPKKELPIYKFYWLKPKVHVIRNDNFFPEGAVKVVEHFVFHTEQMGLSPLYISADYAERFIIRSSNISNAIQDICKQLQINLDLVQLSTTIFYEYSMIPGRADIMARLPVTFFPDIKNIEEIVNNINACGMPNKTGGRMVRDVLVYKKGTETKVLHAVFQVYFSGN